MPQVVEPEEVQACSLPQLVPAAVDGLVAAFQADHEGPVFSSPLQQQSASHSLMARLKSASTSSGPPHGARRRAHPLVDQPGCAG